MKRLLSALITIALVFSLIPAAFAAEEPYTETYAYPKTGVARSLTTITVYNAVIEETAIGNTNWRYFDAPDAVEALTNSNVLLMLSGGPVRMYMKDKGVTAQFSLALKAPASEGFYIPSVGVNNTASGGRDFNWYMADYVSGKDTYDKYAVPANNIASTSLAGYFNSTYSAGKAVYSDGESELITALELKGSNNYEFNAVSLTKILGHTFVTSVENVSLDLEENVTTTASVKVTGTTDGTDETRVERPVAGSFITYKSSNERVATVTANGEITAQAGGEAEIWAETSDGTKSTAVTVTVTAPAEEPEEDETAYGEVSFAQTTNIDGFTGIAVDSVNRGESVTLTAHKQNIEGYKFVGWKRGADTSDKNAWVDIDGDTYSVWSNTYLTAVYEKEDNKNVAFWNQNGAYIGSMTESVYNEQTTLFTPKLTGFGTFLGWFTDGNKPFTAKQTLAAGTTNAVAQYTASATTGVKHNGAAVADAGTYNAPVELNKANANTAWLRDGEPVAYGTTYKFNVWDATDITEGTKEITDKVPVAILDYSDAHKAYMLEYDAGDYEIVEAGIIFGKDTASIKTYTSQRKEKHNQFTVPEEGTLEATGYIIYTLDNGASYKTKYVSVNPAE